MIKEVDRRGGTDLGVYRHGEEFLYDMPKGSAVILSLELAARTPANRSILQEDLALATL